MTQDTKKAITPHVLIGSRIGKLTVVAPTSQRKNGYIVWHCRCDCGGEICLDTRCLQRGTVRDCGCETVVQPGQRDIAGQRFGKLTARYPTGAKGRGGSLIWRCKCDCGGEVDAPLHQLTAGYRKSCGCLSRPASKDFVGKRFGKLVVQKYAGKWEGLHRWLCLCNCGNETVVGQTALQSGKAKSCGCLQKTQIVENLRLVDGTSVTILETLKNRVIVSNTSGYNGVYWNKKAQRWSAQITFKGKTYYLGSYEKIEEAVKARQLGEEMHNNFLKWYYAEHSKIKQETHDGKNREPQE